MQQEINVTEEDIKYAESILLPEGKTFDEERINFIKNFETIDLQAVPGSGKTTALLAKLLILERHLPLRTNRGILILSHTNTAVDEIKDRIGKHCPKLFSYPNFIGTIQSFVDQFLAIPYIVNYLGYKITRVDTETFKEQLWKEFQKIYWDENYNKPGGLFWQRHITESQKISKKTGINANIICNDKIKNEVIDLFFDFSDNKIKLFRDSSTLLATQTNLRFIGIKTAILKVLENGFISYEYAYKMGLNCIDVYPRVIKILQHRFNYVFVDEMQDMDIEQYELLERIFFNEGETRSIYQRIGDKNQAIYGGNVSLENIWTNRETTLNINGSQRLSPCIAELVNCFALSRDGDFKVEGLNQLNIKPHLIVYNNDNIKNVIPRYSTIIKQLIHSNQITDDTKNKYYAVGWVKEKGEMDKIGISDYFENYLSIISKQKNDYPTLDCYLKFFDSEKNTLGIIRKNILNAFIKILRIEDISNPNTNRFYTKKEMLEFISLFDSHEFSKLKLLIFNWCMGVIRGKFDEVYDSIKNYIPLFLSYFGKSKVKSISFVDIPAPPHIIDTKIETSISISNTVNYDNFDINISTIHSAKGQTHTTTLYLETFHKIGNGNYESQRLSNQFKYNLFDNNTLDVVKQSTKMAYVGFSRPTHLLCVAVCKSRFDSHLSDIDRDKWEVIEI